MIIGPSYQLADSRAAIQRGVGWQFIAKNERSHR